MVNVTICGANGKMGRVISSVIKDRTDCTVISGIDLNTEKYGDFEIYGKPKELPAKPDVIIDYSHPTSQNEQRENCLYTGTAVVIAPFLLYTT